MESSSWLEVHTAITLYVTGDGSSSVECATGPVDDSAFPCPLLGLGQFVDQSPGVDPSGVARVVHLVRMSVNNLYEYEDGKFAVAGHFKREE